MSTPSQRDLKQKAAAAYNAAADWYDAPENSFWDRFGTRTVERLALRAGMHVLDVCSGSGASALPAAQAVGPTGSVVAVDAAGELMARLEAKARDRQLRHLETRTGDFLEIDLPRADFDAVVCVFGIFFVADMPAALRFLWRRVTPGGQLAITTWGPRLFEPGNTAFWQAVQREQPDLYKQFNPWDAITSPDALRQVMSSAGITGVDVEMEPGQHRLGDSSAWWALVMGSGYRGTLEQLPDDARERIRAHNLAHLAAIGADAVEASVIYAVARKMP